MMKLFVLFLLCFFSTFSFAQKNEDVIVEPEPHKTEEYFKQDNSSGIKTVYIISKNKKTNFTNDTLNADFYNVEGLKTQTIRFEKNSPVSKLDIEYDENRNRKTSIYTQNNIKERTGTTEFKYNEKNQLLEEEFKSVFAGSTERTVTKKYNYINQKLIDKSIYQSDKLSQKDSFIYDGDKLILHELTYSSGHNNFENVYTYNESGQLIRRETNSLNKDNQKIIYGKADYRYNDDKLVFISEMEGQNLQNNEAVLTFYDYYENGKISKMRVEHKSFYREVAYIYDGRKIVSINVHTNTDNSAYLKFWTSTFGNYIDKMPFNYKEEFGYDHKDNFINKKIFINNELINEVTYLIDYY